MPANDRVQFPDLAPVRVDYGGSAARELSDDDTPASALVDWYAAAAAGVREPNAVAFATAGQGGPTVRIVLVKAMDERGITVYTHYGSTKGVQALGSGRAAATFLWHDVGLQVRLEGLIEASPAAESDAYFASRGRESQLGAAASRQSQPLDDMAGRLARLRAEFDGRPVPRPEGWGGLLLRPVKAEFWRGGGDRLHRRDVFLSPSGEPLPLSSEEWARARLQP